VCFAVESTPPPLVTLTTVGRVATGAVSLSGSDGAGSASAATGTSLLVVEPKQPSVRNVAAHASNMTKLFLR